MEVSPYVVILGIAQDGGYPQTGCLRNCCNKSWEDPSRKRMITCLGLVDPKSDQFWLFEATPDIKHQLHQIKQTRTSSKLAGVFLTHGHMGHYTGLLQFGHEAQGTHQLPVYVMPRMKNFLITNLPWSLLLSKKNIIPVDMLEELEISLSPYLTVVPFLVPHRDEYTETVGFKVVGPKSSFLFIPDIDSWSGFEGTIKQLVKETNIVFVDGTFFQNGEVEGRDMSTFPHPRVRDTMDLFDDLGMEEKRKIHFIHLNHTNPLLDPESAETKIVTSKGYNIAQELCSFPL